MPGEGALVALNLSVRTRRPTNLLVLKSSDTKAISIAIAT